MGYESEGLPESDHDARHGDRYERQTITDADPVTGVSGWHGRGEFGVLHRGQSHPNVRSWLIRKSAAVKVTLTLMHPRQRTQAESVAFFEGVDVTFAPIKNLREAADDPQLRFRQMIVEDARLGGVRHAAVIQTRARRT